MENITQIFRAPFVFYDWVMSQSDPRTLNWPLCGSPFPVLSIILSYIYFVKVLGPRWMKNRPPFKIEKIVLIYNILMVIFSSIFFIYGGLYSYIYPWGVFNWICEPVDYSTEPNSLTLISIGWWFMLLRIVEFSDTIFFVLRKKFDHISHLHVIHHSLVTWGVWIGMKFGLGGSNIFFPFVNCFVHILMYSYYSIAAMGPKMRKHLWWKKHLTILQIVQFVIVIAHAMVPLFHDCGYHTGFAYAVIFHALLFMIMFLNFYRHTYNKNKADEIEATLAKANALQNSKDSENGGIQTYSKIENRNTKMHKKLH